MIFPNIERKISKERQKELIKNNPLKPDDFIQQLWEEPTFLISVSMNNIPGY